MLAASFEAARRSAGKGDGGMLEFRAIMAITPRDDPVS
jgi:hypothetical protein